MAICEVFLWLAEESKSEKTLYRRIWVVAGLIALEKLDLVSL